MFITLVLGIFNLYKKMNCRYLKINISASLVDYFHFFILLLKKKTKKKKKKKIKVVRFPCLVFVAGLHSYMSYRYNLGSLDYAFI